MRPDIEGVLMTGGASRRMGTDKASIVVAGEPMAVRVARALAQRCAPVTVLGRAPLEGFEFLADEEEFAGPLAALSRFRPTRELFFLASCDLVEFQPDLIDELFGRLGDHAAAIPSLEGREQPLCALYRAEALTRLRALAMAGERRVMAWVGSIDALRVPSEDLPHGGACRSVNTKMELANLESKINDVPNSCA